jgi:pimeloyl-ACP methyl ester carboxylesterase
MAYADSAGVRIHYEVAGNGFPLVLQTGGGGDHAMWREAGYVAGLTGFRLVLLDHRGHGMSDRPPGLAAHRIERYVADVLAVLEAERIARAAFWGYSGGATVGYALAAAHPDRIAGLVTTGAIGATDYDTVAEREDAQRRAAYAREHGLLALLARAFDTSPAGGVPPWFWRQMDATDREMFALQLLGAAEWHGPWSVLPRITAPTLLLVGAAEDPDGDNSRAAAAMPNARCVTFAGLDHLTAYVRSDLALGAALPLLRAVAAATG